MTNTAAATAAVMTLSPSFAAIKNAITHSSIPAANIASVYCAIIEKVYQKLDWFVRYSSNGAYTSSMKHSANDTAIPGSMTRSSLFFLLLSIAYS